MKRAIFAIAFALLSTSALVRAQVGTSSITGLVTDSTGAVIPGAAVQAKSETTGVVYDGVTNGTGNYSFPSLTPGPYTINASKASSMGRSVPVRLFHQHHDTVLHLAPYGTRRDHAPNSR